MWLASPERKTRSTNEKKKKKKNGEVCLDVSSPIARFGYLWLDNAHHHPNHNNHNTTSMHCCGAYDAYDYFYS